MGLAVLIFLATLLSSSHARSNFFNPIQLLQGSSAVAADCQNGGTSKCLSWQLTVETHNLQGENMLVPQSCVEHVREYMVDGQYGADCEEVADVAIEYAKSVKPARDGKDVWVFDIDETILSNLPYYQDPEVQYGSKRPSDNQKFYKWVEQGKAAPVPGIQRLYNTTLSLGFSNVILTGLRDSYANIREKNLKEVGFGNWKELIFKNVNASTDQFKSDQRAKLVNEGYRIVGNLGDQWADITGTHIGARTFKVPNPMYYK